MKIFWLWHTKNENRYIIMNNRKTYKVIVPYILTIIIQFRYNRFKTK